MTRDLSNLLVVVYTGDAPHEDDSIRDFLFTNFFNPLNIIPVAGPRSPKRWHQFVYILTRESYAKIIIFSMPFTILRADTLVCEDGQLRSETKFKHLELIYYDLEDFYATENQVYGQ